MKNLKIRKGNSNTALGFNFDYICYMILKKDWFYFKKNDYYDKEYVCVVTQKNAQTLEELKMILDGGEENDRL